MRPPPPQRDALYNDLFARLAREAAKARGFDALLLALASAVRKSLQVDRVAIYALTLDGRSLHPAALVGGDANDPLRPRPLRKGECLTGRAASKRRAVTLDAEVEPLSFEDDPLASGGARSLLAAPATRHGDVVGVVTLALKNEVFDPAEGSFLSDVGAILGLALDAARERNNARREKARMGRLLESLPFGVVTFDAECRVDVATLAAARLLDLSESTLHGSPLDDLFPPSFAHSLRGMTRQTLQFGLIAEETLEIASKQVAPGQQAQRRRVLCSMAPLFGDHEKKDGGVLVLRAAVWDNRPARDEPTAAFVSMVSHELRTPLTSIKGAVHLLSEAPGEEPLDGHRPLIHIVQKNTNRLINLVNDLIDLSQIENDTLSVDAAPTNLAEVLESAWDMVSALAASRRVRVVLEPESPRVDAMADGQLLLQALRHLLENAIKHSPADSAVVAKAERTPDGGASVTVIDQGEGVPADFVPKLFDKFTQAEGYMVRRSSGNGLGLYLVRKIAEGHGGRAELVYSTKDKGSAFRICLPAAVRP